MLSPYQDAGANNHFVYIKDFLKLSRRKYTGFPSALKYFKMSQGNV